MSGRRSGEIGGIEEEDEDEIEEVDDFSPVVESGMEIVMEGETTAGAQTTTGSTGGEEGGKLTLGPPFRDRLSVAVEEDEEESEIKLPIFEKGDKGKDAVSGLPTKEVEKKSEVREKEKETA